MRRLYLVLCFIAFNLVVSGQDVMENKKQLDSITIIDSGEGSFSTLEVIENAPIYKGCNKKASNKDIKQCMSEKIALHFQKHFNTEMHEESDLIPGLKKILLTFKVDKKGNIIDVKAKAEDEYLEAEAIRVTKLITALEPGKQKGKPVIVPFTLPLTVNVIPNKNEGKTRYPIYRGCDKTLNNAELEACSKEKISNFIKMSFDIEMASKVLPTEKSTQFLLEFTITKKGKIKAINAKANHKAIAIEAINVAKRLPKFKEPGLWEGVMVDTPFKLLMTLYFN